jgi:hypothetical protein
MEKQDISNPNIDWADLVRHVARDRVTVELADGSVAIAEVVPKISPVSMKDFASIMASIPLLGPDAEDFAKDIEAVRKNFVDANDPWES